MLVLPHDQHLVVQPKCGQCLAADGGLGSFLTHGGGSGPNLCMDPPVIYKMNP